MTDQQNNTIIKLPGAVAVDTPIPAAPTTPAGNQKDANNGGKQSPAPAQANTEAPKQVTPPSNDSQATTRRKIIGLIGIFILLFVAMLLTVFFLPRGLAYLSNWTSRNSTETEDIIVTASKSRIASGDTVLFSWNGPVRENGAYIVSFACKDGIRGSFHTGEAMTCDEGFFFTTTDNTVALRFESSNTSAVDMPIFIQYKNENEEVSSIGDAVVTIDGSRKNSGGFLGSIINRPNTEPEPTPQEPQEPNEPNEPEAPAPSNPRPNPEPSNPRPTSPRPTVLGPDLRIQLIQTGYLTENNVFIQSNVVPPGMRTAFRFVVHNAGGQRTAPWSFFASLPSQANPYYQSPVQQPLGNGDRIEFTLGYNQNTEGGVATVTVNPGRTTYETSYSNNTLSVQITPVIERR